MLLFYAERTKKKSALSKELFDARSSPLKARGSEKVFVFLGFLESRLKENGPRATQTNEIEKITEKALEKLCIKSKAYLLVVYILRDSRAYTQREIFNHVSHLRAIHITRSRRALAER